MSNVNIQWVFYMVSVWTEEMSVFITTNQDALLKINSKTIIQPLCFGNTDCNRLQRPFFLSAVSFKYIGCSQEATLDSGLCTGEKAALQLRYYKWMNKNKLVTQLLRPHCGTKKIITTKPRLTHPFSYVIDLELWQFQPRRYTHCNYDPHSDRNPISDSSGAFRGGARFDNVPSFLSGETPRRCLGFHTNDNNKHAGKHRPGCGLPSHYQIKQQSNNLWRAIGNLTLHHCVGFVPPSEAQKTNTRASNLRKPSSKPHQEKSTPLPTLSQTLFVSKSPVIMANGHTRLMRHVCSQDVP